MSQRITYYELIRQEDMHTVLGAFFKSVTIHQDPNKENEFTEFPPKAFDHILVFNDIFNYWQTTEAQVVEKISEDEYKFYTLNSTYIVKRLTKEV